MKFLIVAPFIFLLFSLSGIQAQVCCASKENSFTCVSPDIACKNSSEVCPAEDAFKLTADTVEFYPYKLEPVRMAVNLSVPDESASENVTVNSENLEMNGTEYIYVFPNVTKDDESSSFVFLAEGIFNNSTVCSTLSMSIEYVFTVSISTEEERYVLMKGIDGSIEANVETEGDFSRIVVTLGSPINETVPDLKLIKESSHTRLYSIEFLQPIKTEEGQYFFTAIEHATSNHSHIETVGFQVYVHSTLLETEDELVYGELRGNATFVFTATTDLKSWGDVTIQDTHTNGEIHNVPFDETKRSKVTVTYDLTNLTIEDFGLYTFTAIEDAGEFGNTTSSLNMTLFTLSISTTLEQNNESYLVHAGVGGKVSCQVIGVQGNYPTWVHNGSPVSNDSSLDIYQAPGADGEQNLVFTENFTTLNGSSFSCQYSSGMKNVTFQVDDVSVSLTSKGASYSCVVTGNPLPVLTWKMNVEEDEKPVVFDTSVSLSNQNYSDRVNSTIHIQGDPLCFGNNVLRCIAVNDIVRKTEDIRINQDHVGLYRDEYLIYSTNKKTREKAKNDCNDRFDSLAIIPDKETEKSVTKLAEEFGITEFFFGAKKIIGGRWVWDDGSGEVDYPNLATDGEKSCAVYKKSPTSNWEAKAANCLVKKSYACQSTAPYLPSDLKLTPSCNGTSLSAMWTADTSTPTQGVVRNFNDNSEPDNTTILSTAIGNITYNDVQPESEYTVKVYNVFHPQCLLQPGVQAQASTGQSQPADPSNTKIKNNDTKSCNITWDYTNEDGANLDQFYVEVNESVRQQYDAYNGTFVKSYNVSSEKRSLSIDIFPNSVYVAAVTAHSCGRNSSAIITAGQCEAGIDAPASLTTPSFVTINFEGIEITISPAPQRSGPISCQFVVVKLLRPDDNVSIEAVNEEHFLNIKQADEEVNVGEEYFAYATTELSEPETIVLGDNESKSSCIPLPEDNIRKKREIANNTSFTAFNREIPSETPIIYYMVTTTPNEETSTVLFANSKSSQKIAFHQRSSSSPNVAAIVLSILVVIIVLILGVFFYRRWKRNSGKSGGTITFRASGNDYETL